MTRRADPAWVDSKRRDPSTRVVPVWRSHSLVQGEARSFEPVLLSGGAARSLGSEEPDWVFLGLEGDRAIFAAELEAGSAGEPPLSDLGEFHDLHRVGAMLGRSEGSLLAYARAVVTWSRRHRFCGCCGHPTAPRDGGHVRRCANDSCGEDHFPRTDPAIIVLVSDGDRCLLGRKDIWPEGVYSTLAGFVEPGESLSEAVIREVHEESGIEVGNVRYRSSQPWPFPSSLMLGFHADRVGGELRIDGEELADARWFRREDFTRRREIGLRLPSRVSIARRLIRDWLAGT
ncbi:MAG: NAD(+) diphosphatase [Gemmatimonadetes bacterium]|nr:NAD(+) diphosphatase [Gemmatimonadota bacterium]